MPLTRTVNRSEKKLDRTSNTKLFCLRLGVVPAILMVFVYVSTIGLTGCAFAVPGATKNPSSLQLTTPSLPAGHSGQPYFEALSITGGTAPYSWSVSAGSLPSGVTLGTSNGALTGTPSNIGSFNVTINVSDSSATMQTASKAFSMTVMPAVTSVSITTTAVPSGQVGIAYSATLAASGGTTPYSWSISSGALPSGLSLGQTNGSISGMPTTSGQFNFTAMVTDSTAPTQQTGTQSFSLTIAGAAQLPTVTTASLPSGTVSSAYSATLAASGGITPYTWSITAGALPAGLSLASSSGVISGTPTTAGNSSFTVQVTDSKNNTGSQALSISIAAAAQPPTVTTTSLSGGTVSSAYSATLAASGGTTPYTWSITAGALPAGLNLTPSSGVISGTPTASGNSSFTVQVTDSKNNTATQALSISIAAAAQPPTVTTTSLSGGTVSSAYSATLAASGGTTPYTWSITAGALPAGLNLTPSSGVISGTPTTAGNSSFTVQVTDSKNNTGSQALSISIAAVAQPPTVTTTALSGGTVSSAYSATLAASGGTTPYTWSITAGALPAGLNLTASSGVISGTPTASGNSSFTVQVKDSKNNTATQALSISIAATAQPPTVTTTSLPGGTVSSAYSATLAASGGTTPYTWSITSGAVPAGLNLAASSGVISGTPTTAGNSSFTVQVTDSKNNTGSQALSISIAAATQPPTVTTTSLSGGTVSSAYSATLAASGGTTPYTWSITAGALPAGLNLAASSGVISGTPTAAGNSSFTVQVTDSKNNTGSQALSISIAAAAQLPTVTTTSLSGGTVSSAYSATLAASGGTTPYTWSITAGALPAGLNLASSSGVISGTPTTAGNSSFSVQVTDSKNNTGSQALSISIAAAAQPPTVTTTSLSGGTVSSAYSATLAASGGTTPYTWSITAGALPAGLNLASSSGVISGTPTTAGNSSFSVQVTDSKNNTGSQALSISIAAAAQPPTVTTTSLSGGTVSSAYSATLAASGGTTPYTWSITAGALPAALSLTASSGVISGTPTTAGNSSFTVQVTDSKNNTATQALSISIAAAAQPPTVTTTSLSGGTVSSAYSATLAASGGTTPYTWSITAGALPAGLNLTASSGVISGTPTASGNSSFTVQVKDSKNNTATQALSISIAATAQPPTVTTTSLPGGTVSSAYSATLAASGGTTPYTWSITAGALPAGLNLAASSGVISGTPTAAGNSSFTVQVTDSKNNTATQALSISIAAAAQPPTVTTTSLSGGTVSSAYSATLAASGGTTPYTWSITAGALPAGLSLTASSGVISGTPTTAGSSSFTVQVKDAKNNTGSQALSISIAAAAAPTISTSSLPGGTINITYSTTVSASGGTTPYTWGISSGALPAGLNIGASSGVISGTPTVSGSSSFTVQVKDANDATATRTLSISIAAGGTAPQLDEYFGLVNVPCTNSNTSFSITKVGNNELFCTPAGHAMFARGFYVMDLNLEADPDESGKSYQEFVATKYAGSSWYTQELNRIISWGMNSVAPFSNSNLFPTQGQTTKVPFVLFETASTYSLVNKLGWGTGPAKEMFYLLSSNWGGFVGSTGIADYGDPNWAGMVAGVLVNDSATQSVAGSSAANKGYLLGISYDDSDGLHGFGAGPDFATQPAGDNDFRLGYLGFFLAPTDYANSSQQQIYSDATVYLKKRLHDMLLAKYSTVNALNNAWGSGYSTLDSSGTCVGSQPIACATTLSAENVGAGNGSTLSFSHTLAHATVAKFSVGIFVGSTLVGGDTGNGNIYGPDLSGTINYSTGSLSLTFASGHGPASGADITANYIANGWGTGTGFMDDDCRSTHSSYCGTGSGNVTVNLTGIPSNVQDDINALTQDTASHYSSTINAKIQAWAAANGFKGRVPYLGPTTLGTWTTPPDRYVLQGFAGNVDAWQYGGVGTFSQAELDFVNTYMGDVALIEGEYRTANAQSPFAWPNSPCTHLGSSVTCTIASPNQFASKSGFHLDASCNNSDYTVMNVNYSATSSTVTYSANGTPGEASATCNVFFDDANVGGFPSQAARGQDFFNKVSVLPSRSYTATGTHPYLGYFWWQFTDNEAEVLDWGPLTNRDNSYDGNEDVNPIVTCSSPIQGFSCGGELRGPYGNLIQTIQSTNTAIDNTLLGLP